MKQLVSVLVGVLVGMVVALPVAVHAASGQKVVGAASADALTIRGPVAEQDSTSVAGPVTIRSPNQWENINALGVTTCTDYTSTTAISAQVSLDLFGNLTTIQVRVLADGARLHPFQAVDVNTASPAFSYTFVGTVTGSGDHRIQVQWKADFGGVYVENASLNVLSAGYCP
jgi:hypothetical protein